MTKVLSRLRTLRSRSCAHRRSAARPM